uniref:NS1 n=1 Tax=Lanius cristatus densovirus TaxID=2794498 RepID=A0A8A4XDJ8_9VIRU|nr:MAG: NS1 [Lanius cristatus densovirus]
MADIVNLCSKYNCESQSDFFKRVTYKEYRDSYMKHPKDFSYLVDMGVNINLKHILDDQLDRWAIVTGYPHGDPLIIETILRTVGIDPDIFQMAVKTILTMSHNKINTLVMAGPINSCKTLLSNLLTARLTTCYATNHGSLGDFYFAPFLRKAVINLEELQVTCATADDYKSILGGVPLDINRKHVTDRQRLYRTPIIVTTNYDKFGRGMISHMDETALQARCIKFTTHQKYSPLRQVTPNDMAAFLYKYDNKD